MKHFIIAGLALLLSGCATENTDKIYYETLSDCLASAYRIKEERKGDITQIVESCADSAYTVATGKTDRDGFSGGL